MRKREILERKSQNRHCKLQQNIIENSKRCSDCYDLYIADSYPDNIDHNKRASLRYGYKQTDRRSETYNDSYGVSYGDRYATIRYTLHVPRVRQRYLVVGNGFLVCDRCGNYKPISFGLQKLSNKLR